MSIVEGMTKEDKTILLGKLRGNCVRNYTMFNELKGYNGSYDEMRFLLRSTVDNLKRMVFVLEGENSNSELLEEFPLKYVKATCEKRDREYKEFKRKSN